MTFSAYTLQQKVQRPLAMKQNFYCWLLVVLFFSLAQSLVAQVSPEEHASHHPDEVAGGDSATADVANDKGGGMMGGGGGGGMMGSGGMGGMMEKMGAPKPRDLYPTLMSLPELTPEKRAEVLEQAAERVDSGLSLMSEGFDSLSHAAATEDHATMQEAVTRVREGLTRLDSGLAARRAIAEGKTPKNVALQWFKREMNLLPPATAGSGHVLGGSSFHLITIVILAAFAAVMIWMYFFKMRRASKLLEALASPGATSPAPTTEPPAKAPAKQEFPPISLASPDTKPVAPPEFPEMKSRTVPAKKWEGKLRVCRIFDETPGVKTFRLEAKGDLVLPFTYYPGQFLTLALEVEGKVVKRSYTIASTPTQSHFCALTIKREDMGIVSRHLHDTIKEGDLIQASGPNGKFTFTGEEAESIVLVAGGVGITPMMSVIRYLTDIGWHGEIFLLYCCRTTSDFIYREELEQLQVRNANLNVSAFMTRAAGTVWMGFKGRFSAEVIGRMIPEVTTRRIHICGPPAMMDAVVEMFRELQVPEELIKTEAFGPAKKPTGKLPAADLPVPDDAPAVSFTKSEKSAKLTPDMTVLEAAESVDVEIDNSCLSGQCGLCKVKLCSGNVTMEADDALSDEDKAEGIILACQAKATENLEVEA